jgi:phage terminase small subunit
MEKSNERNTMSESKIHAQPEKTLTDKQKHLLTILVETPNITDAAKRAGIGRSTAQRWLREPCFKAELASLRRTSTEEAMNSVHSYTAKAVDRLALLMDSSNEWLQRRVCMDILNRSLKIREVEGLEERIRALEEAFDKN